MLFADVFEPSHVAVMTTEEVGLAGPNLIKACWDAVGTTPYAGREAMLHQSPRYQRRDMAPLREARVEIRLVEVRALQDRESRPGQRDQSTTIRHPGRSFPHPIAARSRSDPERIPPLHRESVPETGRLTVPTKWALPRRHHQ